MGEPTSTNGAQPSADKPRELRPKYSRVLLKLGGEMFGGGAVGLDPDVVAQVARQIAEVVRSGVQVAVVIGGGNFFRGAQLQRRSRKRDGALLRCAQRLRAQRLLACVAARMRRPTRSLRRCVPRSVSSHGARPRPRCGRC